MSSSVSWRAKRTVWAVPEDTPAAHRGITQDANDGNDVVRSRNASCSRGSELVWAHEMALQAGLPLHPYSGEADTTTAQRGPEWSPYSFKMLLGGRSDVAAKLHEKGLKVPYLQQCKDLQKITSGESVVVTGPALSGKSTTMLLGVVHHLLTYTVQRPLVFICVGTKGVADESIAFITEVAPSLAKKVALCNSRPLQNGVQVTIGTSTHINATLKNGAYRDAVTMVVGEEGLLTAKQNKALVKALRDGVQQIDMQSSGPSAEVRNEYIEVQRGDKLNRLVELLTAERKRKGHVVVYPGQDYEDVATHLTAHSIPYTDITDAMTHMERYVATNTWNKHDPNDTSGGTVLLAMDSLPRVPLAASLSILYNPSKDTKENLARCCRMQAGLVLSLAGYDEDEDTVDGEEEEEDGMSESACETASVTASQITRGASQASGDDDDELDATIRSNVSNDAKQIGQTEAEVIAGYTEQFHLGTQALVKGELQKSLGHLRDSKQSKFDDNFDYRTKADSWSGMMLNSDLLRGMSDTLISNPSPIQQRVIPAYLTSSDVFFQASAGSGKTLALCVSILQRLQFGETRLQALVLAENDVLVNQIAMTFIRLSRHQRTDLNVVSRVDKKGPMGRIAIGTPAQVAAASLTDLGVLRTDAFSVFAIDNADAILLDSDTTDLISHVQEADEDASEAEEGDEETHRVQFLIATTLLSAEVRDAAAALFPNATQIKPTDPTAILPPLLKHFTHTAFVKEVALSKLLHAINTYTIVFCSKDSLDQARSGLERVNHLVCAKKWDQEKKTEVLKQMKKVRYLLTDDADLAKGLDNQDVKAIINFDVPRTQEQYIAQAGRTARFGSVGVVITMIDALGNLQHKKEKTPEEIAASAVQRKEEWRWAADSFAPYAPPQAPPIAPRDRNAKDRNAIFATLKEDLKISSTFTKYIMRKADDAAPFQMLRAAVESAGSLTRPELGAVVEYMKNGWFAKKGLEEAAWEVVSEGVKSLCSPVVPVSNLADKLQRKTKRLCLIQIDATIAKSHKDALKLWCDLRRKQRAHVALLWRIWTDFSNMQWKIAELSLTGLRPKKKRFGEGVQEKADASRKRKVCNMKTSYTQLLAKRYFKKGDQAAVVVEESSSSDSGDDSDDSCKEAKVEKKEEAPPAPGKNGGKGKGKGKGDAKGDRKGGKEGAKGAKGGKADKGRKGGKGDKGNKGGKRGPPDRSSRRAFESNGRGRGPVVVDPAEEKW